MEIFNVGDKSINLYLVVSETHRLLIDSGFPNSMNHLGREMRKTGFKIREIDFLIVTHFHIDHAGAIQELKNEGVKFILFDIQRHFIEPMEKMTIGKWQYLPLNLSDTTEIKITDSKEFFNSMNLKGEVLATPGHSEDSISIVFETGEAFTGDLLAEHLLIKEEIEQQNSWSKLKELGIKKIFPSHGIEYLCQ